MAWLPTQDTRAFIILKDGKIVIEQYWGADLIGSCEMTQDSFLYWASAGKTLTAALVGIAEEQKLLKISDRTQEYLGEGWIAMSNIQEQESKIIHQLTMTTGLNDQNVNLDNTDPASLTYLAEPGKCWSYYNAPYTILEKVVENAYFSRSSRYVSGYGEKWSVSDDNTFGRISNRTQGGISR